MALRVALPRPLEVVEEEVKPAEAARVRRLTLTTYLQLDPAIRFVIALALVAAISLFYLVQTSNVTELNYQVQNLRDHAHPVGTRQPAIATRHRPRPVAGAHPRRGGEQAAYGPGGRSIRLCGGAPAGTGTDALPPAGGAPPAQGTVPDGGGGTP